MAKKVTTYLLVLDFISIFLLVITPVCAWNNDELELFDLVEDVGKNFYEFLEIPKDSGPTEVRKAYRRLSLKLHPDKNDAPDASDKFRQLTGIYEVLKEEKRRARYDEILVHGLPDWRQPVFYYRRVRKLGLLEMFVFLAVILTIGQYVVAWSVYWEKKYELEEVLMSKVKRKFKKQSKGGKDLEDTISNAIKDNLPSPKLTNLLPFQLFWFFVWLITSIPSMLVNLKSTAEEWQEARKEAAEAAAILQEENAVPEEKPKKVKRHRVQEFPDLTHEPTNRENAIPELLEADKELKETAVLKTEEWSEEEHLTLVKLMNKIPGGASNRWETIANIMNRPVEQVTDIGKKMKTGQVAIGKGTEHQGITGRLDSRNQVNSTVEFDGKVWSNQQQQALQEALVKFDKSVVKRWDRISECVPGKSKQECIDRCKELSDIIKKKRSNL